MGRGIGMGWQGGKRPPQWAQLIFGLAMLIALAIPIAFGLYQVAGLLKDQYERDKHSQAK